ncbi:MAG: hypothetical protein L6V83_06145 [Christensenella sp.]|nr:MAG: hypothetical protein L6V83_06145 [Christensenella sp.]
MQTPKTRTGFAPLDLCGLHARHKHEQTDLEQLFIGLRYHAGAGKQFTGLFAIRPFESLKKQNKTQVKNSTCVLFGVA